MKRKKTLVSFFQDKNGEEKPVTASVDKKKLAEQDELYKYPLKREHSKEYYEKALKKANEEEAARNKP